MTDANPQDGKERTPRRAVCLTELGTPILLAGAVLLSGGLWAMIWAVS